MSAPGTSIWDGVELLTTRLYEPFTGNSQLAAFEHERCVWQGVGTGLFAAIVALPERTNGTEPPEVQCATDASRS